MLTTYLKFSLIALIFTSIIYAQNPVVNEYSVKFENPTTVSLVGENGLVMRSTNNGQNWVEQNTNVSNVLFGASFSNSVSLAAGENGVILRSADYGETWDAILPGTINNFNDIEIYGSNAAVCGDSGIIYYSVDAGDTWTEAVSNTNFNLNDITFINSSTGFITGDYGTLMKTEDGGRVWNVINLGFTFNKFNAVEAIDADKLIVVGDHGSIFISNDGGNSWFGPGMLMYEVNFNDVLFFDALSGIIVGDDGLLLRTSDGGNSWQYNPSVPGSENYDYHSVAFYDATIGITVGGDGVEIYTTDGGETWSDSAPQNLFANSQGSKSPILTLKQNYPNPFNPSTNISYELPYAANVTLKVYDIAGREVANLFSGYQNTGNHTVNFDASGLSSGVYFYKLSVQNGLNSTTKVNKMILTK